MITQEIIRSVAQEHPCFYLYDEATIRHSIARLQAAFPSAQWLYSVKCNPFAPVLKTVLSCGLGADAASAGEVELSHHLGLADGDIYYSAPGKTVQDLQQAAGKCVLIADSVGELMHLEQLAARQGQVWEAGIRVNPNFSYGDDICHAGKFGIDQDTALTLWDGRFPHLRLVGLHTHLKSQELSLSALTAYHEKMFRLAEQFDAVSGGTLQFINMGSGIGIPYAADDCEMNVEALGEAFERGASVFQAKHPQVKLLLETGRYVVGRAGVYVTHVADKKVSCGKTFVLLQNTLNGFIRPSLGYHLQKCGSAMAEPLYTGPDAFPLVPLTDCTETETVTVTGNLCTGTDIVAADLVLPRLECGDAVLFRNAGAYSAVLSPMQFASLTPPEQLFRTLDGEIL